MRASRTRRRLGTIAVTRTVISYFVVTQCHIHTTKPPFILERLLLPLTP